MKTNALKIVIAAIILCFFSCSKSIMTNNTIKQNSIKSETTKFNNRNIFGASLAKALANSSSLRTLIKNAANKNFDGISEVLYADIREMSVNEGNVNEYIESFTNDKPSFEVAVNDPILTIWVPNLPSNWNVATWNTSSEIPQIGITKNELDSKQTINIYSGNGLVNVIPDSLIPANPTLVVKENSRIILPELASVILNTYSKGSDLPIPYETIYGKQLYYLTQQVKNLANNSQAVSSVNTNGNLVKTTDEIYQSGNVITQKAYYDNPDAAIAFLDFGTNSPRDYVYYRQTPTQSRGSYNASSNTNVECINYLQVLNANLQFPNFSANYTTDPQLLSLISSSPTTISNWWSASGSYEFNFIVMVNSKSGGGSTISKFLFLTPEQLWTVNYIQESIFGGVFYARTTISGNDVNINSLPNQSPLFVLPWDLSQYSIQWNYTTQLFRPYTTQITNTSTYTQSFSENISFNLGTGFVKVGFGASGTQTSTQTYSTITTVTSYPLGNVFVNFTDGIFTSETVTNGGSTIHQISMQNWQTSGPNGSDYNTGILNLQISPQQN